MSTIRPELYDAVRELSELPGPTGHEDAVQDWIYERWSRFADVQRTKVDNVIAKVGGSGRKLMIMGHADEICYMVKSVTDSGFIHLWPYYSDTSGYPPKWMLPLNQPALVLTESGTVPGFFATTSGHAMSMKVREAAKWEWNDWFVDLGLSSRAEAEALDIYPGCRVIWNPKVQRYGPNLITGKAMDDRAALAIATIAGEELAKRSDLTFETPAWLDGAGRERIDRGAEYRRRSRGRSLSEYRCRTGWRQSRPGCAGLSEQVGGRTCRRLSGHVRALLAQTVRPLAGSCAEATTFRRSGLSISNMAVTAPH